MNIANMNNSCHRFDLLVLLKSTQRRVLFVILLRDPVDHQPRLVVCLSLAAKPVESRTDKFS